MPRIDELIDDAVERRIFRTEDETLGFLFNHREWNYASLPNSRLCVEPGTPLYPVRVLELSNHLIDPQTFDVKTVNTFHISFPRETAIGTENITGAFAIRKWAFSFSDVYGCGHLSSSNALERVLVRFLSPVSENTSLPMRVPEFLSVSGQIFPRTRRIVGFMVNRMRLSEFRCV